jgi:hypothetical protein
MSFLLFLVVIALLLVLSVISFGINLLRGILSIFFPSLRRNTNSSFGNRSENNSQSHCDENSANSRKKIFDQSEGDYTEYEEMKK